MNRSHNREDGDSANSRIDHRSESGKPGIQFDLSPTTLAELLDGGQWFRWNQRPDGTWAGVVGRDVATISSQANQCTLRVKVGRSANLQKHLSTDRDWAAIVDQLPWCSDAHLRRCIEAFPGLRILRIPVEEALLGFLCSSMKTIKGIKRMMESLAARFGTKIAPGVYALPSWECLALTAVDDLRACGLGYRAEHVFQTARFLANRAGWLDETTALPYAEAHARLTALPGVGPKIADCVLLFGNGCLEAFPVDVWILRSLQRHYGLTGWRPDQVAHFGRTHFGPYRGLAQQYLFAWERHFGGGSDEAGEEKAPASKEAGACASDRGDCPTTTQIG